MMHLPLARDSFPFLAIVGLAVVVSLFLSSWLAVVPIALLLFIAYFFRDPERTSPDEEGLVLAPADGRVVRLLDEGAEKTLSIFLSVLDVHVNRSPVSGTVERVEYHRGRFQAAFRHGASAENERNAIEIRSPLGRVRAVQIAGLLARRIVCTARPGDRLRAGQRIGMIKLGSRMDVTVPAEVEWSVAVGDAVRAGVTVLGRAPRPAARVEQAEAGRAPSARPAHGAAGRSS